MAILVTRCKRWVSLAFVLAATSAASIAQSQDFASQPAALEAASPPGSSLPADLTTDDIIAKMLEQNRLRSEKLSRYFAVRTYELKNSQGKVVAQTVVRVGYEAPDKKTFDKTFEEGSAIVRHLVFDRLMQSERETSSGSEHHDSAITTANYSFAPAGQENVGPYQCFAFEVTPRRKDKYLFEGKIWIDAKDFAIVKIAGHPAKKPSFWIKQADFVRQYQKIDGFWLPYRDETSVDVRMYGRKIFTVDHQQYVVDPANFAQAENGGAAAGEAK
jgi:hypothetical protein